MSKYNLSSITLFVWNQLNMLLRHARAYQIKANLFALFFV